MAKMGLRCLFYETTGKTTCPFHTIRFKGESMGNQDNWTTPKQIKIERAGEPKGTKRGKLKKGERRKGKKARLDEILSAKNDCVRYSQHIKDDAQRRREHPQWYTPFEGPGTRYDPEYRKWFEKALVKLKTLLKKAIKDGVITENEAVYYEVTSCVQ